MAERKIIVDKLRLTYEGLFSVSELFKLVDTYFREKGYDKREKMNFEKVTPTGKFINLEIQPWKKFTDYVKCEVEMRLVMSDLKEVEVEREGVKIKLNQGKVQIVFDGWLTTDYENRWEGKPFFYFLRTIFDKYIYRVYTNKYEHHVIEDVNQIHDRIKGLLNLYRYTTEAATTPIEQPWSGF